ncbi:SPOR domain-containing protein [Neolewinella lacunae]|uniref:SPOR domain-containing protein n=1 Tax=Neolewinella lacunae TaxID=1517758 RepID=A0A923PM91_9BACT|nr:SPOR domain-containing protein [Neolewinella lacunae]MBC6993768.1 SPOR domain-containing protein [Neolewinella lacunae]MDN3636140.1 SPOR domain-containing protein [Neolewinella lacunae]
MKNTSILLPIILIGCIAAVLYLFYAALQATDDQPGNTAPPIVLDPTDYAEERAPADLGANTNLDPYFQPVSAEEAAADSIAAANFAAQEADPRPENSPSNEGVPANDDSPSYESTTSVRTPPVRPDPAPNYPTTPVETSEGRYLVIAGSFRQMVNADERVRALRKAGFAETRLEKFNRSTYAVALAGQSDSYSEANRLAQSVRAKGFEAEVMRRRE